MVVVVVVYCEVLVPEGDDPFTQLTLDRETPDTGSIVVGASQHPPNPFNTVQLQLYLIHYLKCYIIKRETVQ